MTRAVCPAKEFEYRAIDFRAEDESDIGETVGEKQREGRSRRPGQPATDQFDAEMNRLDRFHQLRPVERTGWSGGDVGSEADAQFELERETREEGEGLVVRTAHVDHRCGDGIALADRDLPALRRGPEQRQHRRLRAHRIGDIRRRREVARREHRALGPRPHEPFGEGHDVRIKGWLVGIHRWGPFCLGAGKPRQGRRRLDRG